MRNSNRGHHMGNTNKSRMKFVMMPLLLMVTDYISILLSEYVAHAIRLFVPPAISGEFYIPTIYFYIVVPAIFLSYLYSANTHIRYMPFWRLAEIIFKATIYSVLTIILFMFVFVYFLFVL